jgi:hypothetical protein
MLKGAVVGVLALTIGISFAAAAEPSGSADNQQEERATTQHRGPVIKEAHIARLRAALNLTPEQQKYWAPVESALRALARQQAREEASAGVVQRMSDRASAMAGTAVHLKRLVSAAAPLIKVLDESQKRSAMTFARNAGFGHLAQAF